MIKIHQTWHLTLNEIQQLEIPMPMHFIDNVNTAINCKFEKSIADIISKILQRQNNLIRQKNNWKLWLTATCRHTRAKQDRTIYVVMDVTERKIYRWHFGVYIRYKRYNGSRIFIWTIASTCLLTLTKLARYKKFW